MTRDELDPVDDLLYRRWLVDPSSLEPAELARLESSPELRRGLTEALRVKNQLDELGAALRAGMVREACEATAEPPAGYRQHVRELLQASRRRSRRRRLLLPLLAVAAAAAVAIGLALALGGAGGHREPQPPRFLNHERLPLDPPAADGTVRWRRAPVPPETVTVHVLAPDGTPLAEPEQLSAGETRWRPSPELARRLPAEYEVRVVLRDGDGAEIARASLVVRRPIAAVAPAADDLATAARCEQLLRDAGTDARAERAAFEALDAAVQQAAQRTPGQADGLLAALAQAVRRGGRPDIAVQTDNLRIERWLQEGRLAEATRVADEILAGDVSADPRGAVSAHLYAAQLHVEQLDVASRHVAAARALLGEVAAYGREALADSECTVLGIELRLHVLRGRADLALRTALRERELAESLTGDSEEVRRRKAQARIDLVDAQLASRRPEQAAASCDEALQHVGPSAERAELLARRGVARAMASPDGLAAALADLAAAAASPHCDGQLAFSCAVRRAAYLEMAARSGEARRAVAAAAARRDPLVAGGQRPSAADTLYLRALQSRLLAADAPTASRRRCHERLAAAFERLLQRFGALGEREVAPLCDRARQMALGELIRTRTAEGAAGVRAAFELLVRAQALGSIARAAGFAAASVAEVRDALVPDGGALLVYAFGWPTSHLFVLESDRLRHYALRVDEGEVRAAARERRTAVLADQLLPAAVRRALAAGRWPRLTVVGLAAVGHVAFGRLPLGEGQVVLDHSAVCHLESVPVGLLMRARAARRPAPATGAGAVLLAAPRTGEGSLELSRGERAALVTGAVAVREHLGKDATRRALAADDLPESAVLVVAAHGVRDSSTGAQCVALAPADVADDGVLQPSDLRQLVSGIEAAPRLPRLVVLYVCRAGRQPVLPGEDGGQGLAGACLLAGARAVVVAQNDLRLDVAVAFAEHFGRALAAGRSVAGAHRQAMLALAAAGLDAGGYLYVEGLGHRLRWPVAARQWPSWPWLLLVALALVAAGGLALRRHRRRLTV